MDTKRYYLGRSFGIQDIYNEFLQNIIFIPNDYTQYFPNKLKVPWLLQVERSVHD